MYDHFRDQVNNSKNKGKTMLFIYTQSILEAVSQSFNTFGRMSSSCFIILETQQQDKHRPTVFPSNPIQMLYTGEGIQSYIPFRQGLSLF